MTFKQIAASAIASQVAAASVVQAKAVNDSGSSGPVSASFDPDRINADILLSDTNYAAEPTVFTNVFRRAFATMPKTSGKWYAEIEPVEISGKTPNLNACAVGLMPWAETPTLTGNLGVAGSGGYQIHNSLAGHPTLNKLRRWFNGSFSDSAFTFAATVGVEPCIYRIAVDLDAGNLWLGQDGQWFTAGADPATGTSPTYTGLSSVTGFVLAAHFYGSQVHKFRIYSGRESSNYAVPSGYEAVWA